MMFLVLLGQRILKQTNDDAILLILEFYEFLLMLVGWLVVAGWGLHSICMLCMVCKGIRVGSRIPSVWYVWYA